jgi:hypothetical protein
MRHRTGGVSSHAPPHWRRVGSRAAAGTTRKQGNQDWLLLLFFSSPAVRITVTCKRRKTHKAVDFNFFLLPGLGSVLFLI